MGESIGIPGSKNGGIVPIIKPYVNALFPYIGYIGLKNKPYLWHKYLQSSVPEMAIEKRKLNPYVRIWVYYSNSLV